MPRFKNFEKIDKNIPVLIAGQTASGKSQIAIDIAEKQGGIIINADAIVFLIERHLALYTCENWTSSHRGAFTKQNNLQNNLQDYRRKNTIQLLCFKLWNLILT